MAALVARTGRQRQRYNNGFRLMAGCIPYRFTRTGDACDGESVETLEVLMVMRRRGDGFIFPKGGWKDDETKEEAALREALEEAGVKGHIEVTVKEANDLCRQPWMLKALEKLLKLFDCYISPDSVSQSTCEDEEPSEQSTCEDEEHSEQLTFEDEEHSEQLTCEDEEPSEQSTCEETDSSLATIESNDAGSDDEAPSYLTEENECAFSE